MKKRYLPLFVLSLSAFAQTNTSPFERIGLKDFSTEESMSFWNESLSLMRNNADCMRYWRGHQTQRISLNSSTPTYSSSGTPVANISEHCKGFFDSVAADKKYNALQMYIATMADSSVNERPDGVTKSNDNKVGTDVFGFMRPLEYKGKNPIPDLSNMRCMTMGPDGSEMNAKYDEGKFKSDHNEIILANKNIKGFSSSKGQKSLSSLADKFCSIAKNDASSRGLFVEYDDGPGGSLVIYNKELDSAAEALPYIYFVTDRHNLGSQDLLESNMGSSDKGADQLGRQLMKPYEGNENRGTSLATGKSVAQSLVGSSEGMNGSSTYMAWRLCVEVDPQKYGKPDRKNNPSLDENQDESDVELSAHAVGISMPNNVISPFPLVVKNGDIDKDSTKVVNENGELVLDFDKPHFHYGPRNTKLSKEEKEQLKNSAVAMKKSADQFVKKTFNNPESEIDLEKSTFQVQSCSNRLVNQAGYKNWDTTGKLEAQEGNERISFDDLSNLRNEAQSFIAVSLLENERKKSIKDLEGLIQGYERGYQAMSNTHPDKSALKNKIAYYQDKVKKMKATDFSKIKIEKLPCGEDGVVGPDPYFNNIAKGESIPSSSGKSKSVYYTEISNLSKKLKTKDVQDKLESTRKKLDEERKSAKPNKAVIKQLENWESMYKKILAKEDGKPGYLEIPLLGLGATKFPCDPNYPDQNITCDIAQSNNEALNSFKTESIHLDLDKKEVVADKDVLNGRIGSGDEIVIPPAAKMYFAGIQCTRKYKDSKKKKKKCVSKTTGWEIPCDGFGNSSKATRQ